MLSAATFLILILATITVVEVKVTPPKFIVVFLFPRLKKKSCFMQGDIETHVFTSGASCGVSTEIKREHFADGGNSACSLVTVAEPCKAL